jgi:hypothetical protein
VGIAVAVLALAGGGAAYFAPGLFKATGPAGTASAKAEPSRGEESRSQETAKDASSKESAKPDEVKPSGTKGLSSLPKESGKVKGSKTKDKRAPKLPKETLFDEDFHSAKSASAFGPAKNAKAGKGTSWDYVDGKYRIVLRSGNRSNHLWPCGPLSDFACQLTGHVMEPPSAEWGLTILPAGSEKEGGIDLVLNGKGQLEVKQSPNAGETFLKAPVGPVTHSAIRHGKESNTLLAILRGRHLEVFVNDAAVCDPITLERDLAPAKLKLWGHSHVVPASPASPATVEFDRARVWSAKDLPSR